MENMVRRNAEVVKEPVRNGLRFDGWFNEKICALLRQKRLEAGASYRQLSNVTGIHWSTLRKWEDGLTTHCNGYHLMTVQAMIDGKFDRKLHSIVNQPTYVEQLWHNLSPEVNEALEKLLRVSALCGIHPKIEKKLTDYINLTVNETISEMLRECDHHSNEKPKG